MAFSSFNISELVEESDNDYAIEFQTNDTIQGIQVTEGEAEAVGKALLEAVENNPSAIDGQSVDEVIGE